LILYIFIFLIFYYQFFIRCQHDENYGADFPNEPHFSKKLCLFEHKKYNEETEICMNEIIETDEAKNAVTTNSKNFEIQTILKFDQNQINNRKQSTATSSKHSNKFIDEI